MEKNLETLIFYEKMRFCNYFWKDELEPLVKKYSVQHDFGYAYYDLDYEELNIYFEDSSKDKLVLKCRVIQEQNKLKLISCNYKETKKLFETLCSKKITNLYIDPAIFPEIEFVNADYRYFRTFVNKIKGRKK